MSVVLNVQLFGAIPDYRRDPDPARRGTDCADAIMAAIRALDPKKGGVVEIPYGHYRVAKTIDVDRKVVIRGHGSDLSFGATNLVCDEGVTCFRFWSNSQIAPGQDPLQNNAGSQESVLSNLKISTSGKKTTTAVGSYGGAGSFEVTGLTTPNDFRDGQLIRIPGGGTYSPLERVTASVAAAGTNQVTITGPEVGELHGIHPGAYLRIPGAFPTKTRVVSVPTSVSGTSYTLTVSTASQGAALAQPVTYVRDAVARIRSGGGTSTLLLDYGSGEAAPDVEIAHSDAGLHIMTRVHVHDVSVGAPDECDFAGPGILISASSGWSPAPGYNANCWQLTNVSAYGNLGGTLVVQGNDANAGTAYGLIAVGSPVAPRWIVQDSSGLGNTYVGCHATGGYGYLTEGAAGSISQGATFLGCYREGGTFCSFGLGTRIVGGTMPFHAGGTSWVGPHVNRMIRGRSQEGSAFSTLQESFDPDQGIRYRASVASSGTADTDFRPLQSGDGAPAGFHALGWHHASGSGRTPLMFTDTASTFAGMANPAENAGHAVLWRGAFLGGAERGGTMSQLAADTRYIGFASAPPTAGARTWKKGDILFNDNNVAGNDHVLLWKCTATGDPGTWQAHEL